MNEKFIVKDFPRVEESVITKFEHYDSSTIYEAQGKSGLLNHNIRPIQQGASICGSAVTVVCHAGDNLMIHAAIEVCQPNDILVVSTIGDSHAGMIGELIVLALQKKQVKGLVIDAGVRDVERIRQLNFPVWSKSIYPEGTTKLKGGWVNTEAICGGVLIRPGDLIFADDDGVVTMKRSEVNAVLEAAESRYQKEIVTKEKISRGELGIDFYGLRNVLEKEGVAYYGNINEMGK